MSNFYKIHEFAKKAGVTERTLRYYDKIELLKPSYKNEALHRFYTDEDFKNLQKIIGLKFLGFSIAEIKEYDLDNKEKTEELINKQKRAIDIKIKNLSVIRESLDMVDNNLKATDRVDWDVLIEDINSLRLSKHKKRDGVKENIDESYRKNHKIMLDLLVEFSKTRKKDKKIEILQKLNLSVNNMEEREDGLERLLKVLEEVDVIPEDLRGVNSKDIENLIEFIRIYIETEKK